MNRPLFVLQTNFVSALPRSVVDLVRKHRADVRPGIAGMCLEDLCDS
jgi:hypothetical protein